MSSFMHKQWAEERKQMSIDDRVEALEVDFESHGLQIQKIIKGQKRLIGKIKRKNKEVWGTAFALVAVLAIVFYWHLGMVTENIVLKTQTQVQKIINEHEKDYHSK